MQALWQLAHSPHHLLSRMQLNALFAKALFSCISKSKIQIFKSDFSCISKQAQFCKIDIRLCVCRPMALGIAWCVSS